MRLAFEGAGRLEFEVQAAGPARLLLRDTWARGWEAHVNGVATPLERDDGLHRAVPLHAGRQRVDLAYRAPGLTAGLALEPGERPRGRAPAASARPGFDPAALPPL